jgi:hypothetical protein
VHRAAYPSEPSSCCYSRWSEEDSDHPASPSYSPDSPDEDANEDDESIIVNVKVQRLVIDLTGKDEDKSSCIPDEDDEVDSDLMRVAKQEDLFRIYNTGYRC